MFGAHDVLAAAGEDSSRGTFANTRDQTSEISAVSLLPGTTSVPTLCRFGLGQGRVWRSGQVTIGGGRGPGAVAGGPP